MVTASKVKILEKRYIPMNDTVPQGFMTAEEWRGRCRKNISEIFRKHEQGILQCSI